MIDRATVERIKDAANIVEVVSEFVTLRRSGANYKGLCPFHDEKTPSFIVSPARGTCHCFGCGRGGNSVSFIMEHEQLTYPEALRWLARKYGIEVIEKELTSKERQEQSEREAMFIVNEWASQYFENLLHNTDDGQAIGMQYFRSRGFRDDIIAKYHLGYDLRDRHALARQAKKEGYKDEFLLKTGICYQADRGGLIDRFASRVIFPWIGLSGKVVGFSARVLDSRTKGVQQKYVNSPDSEVYHKDRELFGLYQAKKSIAKEDRVYIVEGQTDVLSLAQCGIENVVANSGTALSTHQINILHRFTENVTLLYDSDEAGIHAAFRGMDMLLSEGMHVRVLLLPEGDDPDSFARKHNAEEFLRYIEENQLDFIQFKTKFLLSHATDPQKRTEAIDSIVVSISYVPNQVLRDTYLHDASAAVGIKEATLISRMNTIIKERKQGNNSPSTPKEQPKEAEDDEHSQQIERMITQLVVRYGEQIVAKDVENEDGNKVDLTLAEYVYHNLEADNLQLQNPLYQSILNILAQQKPKSGFVAEQYLLHHDDLNISRAAMELLVDKYGFVLPKSESRAPSASNDDYETNTFMERLRSQAEHLMLDFRMDYIDEKIKEMKNRLTQPSLTEKEKHGLMAEYSKLLTTRNRLARLVGLNVV